MTTEKVTVVSSQPTYKQPEKISFIMVTYGKGETVRVDDTEASLEVFNELMEKLYWRTWRERQGRLLGPMTEEYRIEIEPWDHASGVWTLYYGNQRMDTWGRYIRIGGRDIFKDQHGRLIYCACCDNLPEDMAETYSVLWRYYHMRNAR